MTEKILAIVLAIVASLATVKATACPGCVDLDELSFNATVKHFKYALIKFDIAFPYGEKHEAFGDFSRAAHKVTEDLMVATVGIKDYGELENRNLGTRYDVDEKNLPVVVLFYGDINKYVKLPSHLDVTLDNLKSFVTEKTEYYIGRDGCVKSLEDAVKNYANLDEPTRKATYERVQKLAKDLKTQTEQEHAKVYLAFMEKINGKGYVFVEEETKRLLRLRAGKVSDSKKVELTHKLNILEAFRVNKLAEAQSTAEPNEEQQDKKQEL